MWDAQMQPVRCPRRALYWLRLPQPSRFDRRSFPIPLATCRERACRLGLVRYLPDGNKFLGRIDHQVKAARLHRTWEIEAVSTTAVRQTIVAREDIPGDKRLVAYVVPYQEHALT